MIKLKFLIRENTEVNSKKMAEMIRLALSTILDVDKEFVVTKFASNYESSELSLAKAGKRKPEVGDGRFAEFSMGFLFHYKVRSYFAHVYFFYLMAPKGSGASTGFKSTVGRTQPTFPTIDMVKSRHPQLTYHADVYEYEPSNVPFEDVVKKFLNKRVSVHNGWEWKGLLLNNTNNIADLVKEIKKVCDDKGPDDGEDSPEVPDPTPSSAKKLAKV